MAEQRCIICGNIVKFNMGERFAACEYCETTQELNGAFSETAPKEPIIHAADTLERAKKIDIDEIRRRNAHSVPPVKKPFVGSFVATTSEALFKHIDDEDDEIVPDETSNQNSALKVVGVLVAMVVVLGVIALLTGQL